MTQLSRAMELVGRKWALHIIEVLLDGPRRFTEIERSLAGVNPRLVTTRLRELEADGLLTRTTYAEVPPRVVYALTARGRTLGPAIAELRRFGVRAARGRFP
jgi:DNA-binding HxlR family transcriptional regulator